MQVKSMEHTQVVGVRGLVALAQRFLVLKWISTRQSTPTLQKGESLTSNCQACGHCSQLAVQMKASASQAMQGACSSIVVDLWFLLGIHLFHFLFILSNNSISNRQNGIFCVQIMELMCSYACRTFLSNSISRPEPSNHACISQRSWQLYIRSQSKFCAE